MKKSVANLIICGLAIVSACAVKNEIDVKDIISGDEVVFTAECVANNTKTEVQSDGSVYWNPEDAICIYYGGSAGDKFIAQNNNLVATTEFRGTLSETGNPGDYYWALYPYDSAISCDGNAITAFLPHSQVAQAGSFAPNTNITIAKSLSRNLSFYNVCSGMWFTVTKEGIESVTFKGNNNEDVAGTFTVSMSDGTPSIPTSPIITSGRKSITLSAPSGQTLQVGERYYFVVLPQVFSAGVTLTFNTDTETGSRVYGNALTFGRSSFPHSENADQNVVFGPKAIPSVVVAPGAGTIILPEDIGPDEVMNLDFSNVKDGGDYVIQYSAEDGAKKPGTILIVGDAETSVGQLSGNLPFSTVHVVSGSYESTSFITAISTLVIEEDAIVQTVQVRGGGAVINAPVVSLSVEEDAAVSDELEDRIKVTINNAVGSVQVSETNCDVVVNGNGSVTGSLETEAATTTINSGAFVNSLEASGDGAVTISDDVTIESISASGNVELTLADNVTNSNGEAPLTFVVAVGDGSGTVPSEGVESLQVKVTSNVTWSLSIISEGGWVTTQSGQASFASDKDETFYLEVAPNTSTSGRQSTLRFTYGDKTTDYTLSQEGATTSPGEEKPASNEIWYTTKTGMGLNISVGGVVSHTYENGKGVITFSSELTGLADIFKGQSSLVSINLPNSITFLGKDAFYECTELESISLPENLTSIGAYAFSATKLSSVTLPESVEEMGMSVFYACYSLEEVHLPSQITTIPDYTFYSNQKLKTVTFSPSLEKVGISAFEYCKSLEEIVVPSGCEELAYRAFYQCEGLKRLVIPSSITTIGNEALFKCTGKLEIGMNIPDRSTKDMFSVTYFDEVVLTEGVTVVGQRAFYQCTSLKKVTFPSTLQYIQDYAFSASGIEGDLVIPGNMNLQVGAFANCSSLTSITLEEGFVDIPAKCFQFCSGVQTISLPKSLEVIEDQAFYRATGVATLRSDVEITYVPGDYYAEYGGFYGSYISSVVFGTQVTRINNLMFFGCEKLTTVDIPDNIEVIGEKAFMNCPLLSDLSLPFSLKTIGREAFRNCWMLGDVTIPENVVNLGIYAFNEAGRDKEGNTITINCNIPDRVPENIGPMGTTLYASLGFDRIVFGEGVTSIGDYALHGSRATELVLPESLETIGAYALGWLSGLVSLVIPDGVSEIPEWLCEHCEALSSVQLPASLKSIGDYAFSYCPLASLTLPEGLESIGNGSFSGFDSYFTEVTIPSTVTDIGARWLPVTVETLNMLPATPPVSSATPFYAPSQLRSTLRIIVPVKSLKAYKNTSPWNSVKDYIFPDQDVPDGYGDPGHPGTDLNESDDKTYDF